ncbi:hypothetical protein AAFF_G00120510 [Aldrovandia affinis]|uniref:G-protein coupled receptors family 1 profile domain-containing protein n=1 Tax=Aldrovandia affinis TaxID=143900 RepID=A0AAD7RSJ1_9TELE|nr:hypothetical protein AAFF_G00120510 [Aldrovandia affinis]
MEGLLSNGSGAPNGTAAPSDPLRPRPAPERTAVALLLAALTLLTALANAGVIAAICTTRKLHLPANYLICSLAVTDLLVAVLVMPLSALYIGTETWALGRAACEAWLSADMTCCTCSILHLCAIALDRYWAITDAVDYARKRTPRRAAAMVTAVWALSVLISVPPLFWRRSSGAAAGAGPSSSSRCVIEHDHVGYTVYSTLGAFYVPMALILVLYCRIYGAAKTLYQKRGSSRHLSGRSAGGSQSSLGRCRVAHTFCAAQLASASDPALEFERLDAAAAAGGAVRFPPFGAEAEAEAEAEGASERSQICSSRERKAARILGLILGAFVLCWLPFFVKELLVGLRAVRPSPRLSDLLTWLGYVNSLVNPLLYTSFNDDFKQAFRRLVRCREHA